MSCIFAPVWCNSGSGEAYVSVEHGPLNILLVEDDEIDRMAIRRAVRKSRSQITLHEAPDLTTSFKVLEEQTFDCVLVDYRLPDGDGLELLNHIQHTLSAPPPLIFLTGMDDTSIARAALQQGAQDYLTKNNINPELLLRSIRYAIERKRATDLRHRLIQADRLSLLGQMASGLSHEINNPAAWISTNMGLLKEHMQALLDITEYVQDTLEMAPDSALKSILAPKVDALNLEESREDILSIFEDNAAGMDRIMATVQRLKGFSLVAEHRVEELHIHELLHEARSQLQHELNTSIPIEIDVPADMPALVVERRPILQVLGNLLINAVEAIQRAPQRDHRIRIVASHTPKTMTLVIEDTGGGVPNAVRRNLFEPFVTTNTTQWGRGLGLSLCADIASQHNGTLRLHSTSQEGSAFELVLPLQNELGQHTTAANNAHKMTIIVVNADTIFEEAAQRLLKFHDVLWTQEPRTAVLHAQKTDADLILCMSDSNAHNVLLQEAPELAPRIIVIHPTPSPDTQPRNALSAPVTPSALHFVLKATQRRDNRTNTPSS